MSSISARLVGQQQLGWFPHTDVSGDVWRRIKCGLATSNGASDGTTIIDTNGDSGVADTYNGRYWVRMRAGANSGLVARIVDDDGAGTLTLEGSGLPNQVATNNEYEIWQSPEPVINVTTATSAVSIADSVRTDEADDYWNGFYAVPITGAQRGRIGQITDFVKSTGTFTFASNSFTAAGFAVGDVILLRKFIEFAKPSDGLTESYHERLSARLNFSKGDGVTGARGGDFGFTAQMIATAANIPAGTKCTRSQLSGLLEACGLEETLGTSCTIAAGSTTSAIKVNTGSWENLSIGAMVTWNGNAAFVTSLEDGGGSADTVNVTPPFPVAPTAASLLRATAMYAKSTDGDGVRSVGFEWERDGLRVTMTGCKGNATIPTGDGALEADFKFSVDNWTEGVEAAPYDASSAYTTVRPILASERFAYLDTTPADIGGFTTSPNAKVAPRKVQGAIGLNGQAGLQLVGYACGATFREISSSSDTFPHRLLWTARTAKDFIVVFGSHAKTVAVRIPVARLIERPKLTDEGGIGVVPEVVEAQDAGTATDGNGTLQKVPDYAIHIS